MAPNNSRRLPFAGQPPDVDAQGGHSDAQAKTQVDAEDAFPRLVAAKMLTLYFPYRFLEILNCNREKSLFSLSARFSCLSAA